MARLLLVLRVEVAVAADAGHIVHGACHRSLDAHVGSGSVQSDASPSADADDANTLCVYLVMLRQEVNSRHKVLGVDVRRCRAARLTAALTCIGGVEGQGHKTSFGHPHGIESARLLLAGAKGATDGNSRESLTSHLLPLTSWNIQIGCEGQSVLCFKRHLPVVYLVTLWEHLVPLLRQFQFLHILFCFSLIVFLVASRQHSGCEHCCKYEFLHLSIFFPFLMIIPFVCSWANVP